MDPNPSSSGMLLILTGVSSAAGKDTVMRRLLEIFPNLERIVTVNTRPMRVGEIEGVDHYFRSKEHFVDMLRANGFFEWKEFAGNFYGTPKSEIEKALSGKMIIWRIDPTMALKVQATLVDFFGEDKGREIWSHTLTIFLDAPNKQTILRRMMERGASEQEVSLRLEEVWKERNEVIGKFEHVVVNIDGKLEKTIEEVIELMSEFRPSLRVKPFA